MKLPLIPLFCFYLINTFTTSLTLFLESDLDNNAEVENNRVLGIASRRSKRNYDEQIRCPQNVRQAITLCDIEGTVKKCKVACKPKNKFPDGTKMKTYSCTSTSDGWMQSVNIPDCVPQEYIHDCSPGKGDNQKHTCHFTSDIVTCNANCFPGYRFPNGKKQMKIVCRKNDGIFIPIDKFPDCIYSGDDSNLDELEEKKEHIKELLPVLF